MRKIKNIPHTIRRGTNCTCRSIREVQPRGCQLLYSPVLFWGIEIYLKGVTPFFKIIFPYFAVSPVITTAKADFARS